MINNCFVAELTLKLFGIPTASDMEEILRVVGELLETDDVGEALGDEKGLIEDPTLNSTETDADQEPAKAKTLGSSHQTSTLLEWNKVRHLAEMRS